MLKLPLGLTGKSFRWKIQQNFHGNTKSKFFINLNELEKLSNRKTQSMTDNFVSQTTSVNQLNKAGDELADNKLKSIFHLLVTDIFSQNQHLQLRHHQSTD